MSDLAILTPAAEALIALCGRRGLKIATAESCTGGMIATALTEVPGSSAVFERGFVTYANRAKTELLGVPEDLIAGVGAVSEEVAVAMAEGALTHSPADLAVAVTGIAGPDGGTAAKPVGLVHVAVARRGGGTKHAVHLFKNFSRSDFRLATVREALAMLQAMASE